MSPFKRQVCLSRGDSATEKIQAWYKERHPRIYDFYLRHGWSH